MKEVMIHEQEASLPTLQAANGNETAAIMSAIIKISSDPTMDISKLERMLEMHERLQAKQAEKAYNAALTFVQDKNLTVAKRALNKHTKSTYETLEDVNNVAMPHITKAGFSLSFNTKMKDEKTITLYCTVRHVDGHKELHELDVDIDNVGLGGNANKTQIQGVASSITYGRRALIKMIFNISTTDDDDGNGGGTGATISEAQYKILTDLIVKAPDNVRSEFVKTYGAIKDIPRDKFDLALATLKGSAA